MPKMYANHTISEKCILKFLLHYFINTCLASLLIVMLYAVSLAPVLIFCFSSLYKLTLFITSLNSSSFILLPLIAIETISKMLEILLSASILILSCMLALMANLFLIYFPISPKSPHSTAPDSVPTTIGTAIIVDRSPIPPAPNQIDIVISTLLIVSVIFMHRLYLYNMACFSCSLSRVSFSFAMCISLYLEYMVEFFTLANKRDVYYSLFIWGLQLL